MDKAREIKINELKSWNDDPLITHIMADPKTFDNILIGKQAFLFCPNDDCIKPGGHLWIYRDDGGLDSPGIFMKAVIRDKIDSVKDYEEYLVNGKCYFVTKDYDKEDCCVLLVDSVTKVKRDD